MTTATNTQVKLEDIDTIYNSGGKYVLDFGNVGGDDFMDLVDKYPPTENIIHQQEADTKAGEDWMMFLDSSGESILKFVCDHGIFNTNSGHIMLDSHNDIINVNSVFNDDNHFDGYTFFNDYYIRRAAVMKTPENSIYVFELESGDFIVKFLPEGDPIPTDDDIQNTHSILSDREKAIIKEKMKVVEEIYHKEWERANELLHTINNEYEVVQFCN